MGGLQPPNPAVYRISFLSHHIWAISIQSPLNVGHPLHHWPYLTDIETPSKTRPLLLYGSVAACWPTSLKISVTITAFPKHPTHHSEDSMYSTHQPFSVHGLINQRVTCQKVLLQPLSFSNMQIETCGNFVIVKAHFWSENC